LDEKKKTRVDVETCHSDYGKIKTVFIKRAGDAFGSEDQLAREWKQLNFLSKPELQKAALEYSVFEGLLKSEGADLHYFPKDGLLPIDSIYCRDASIATDAGMILCNMGKPARRVEPGAQKKAFEREGITILGEITGEGTVEGGDVAWLDRQTLAVGLTYRTNQEGIRQLKALLGPIGVEVLPVPLPHYKGPSDVFHLMSILSPVDRSLAVIYSPLMPIIFREELRRRGYSFIEVPDEEFDSMGCNVLAIAPRRCLMVKGNPRTKLAMEKAGCQVLEYDGSEISVKGGGGPTCLTRPLKREF
jgi:N-dimethylarginine dimethylaminohydrolase